MIEVKWVLLCKQFEITPGGSQNVLGITLDLFTQGVPFVIPQLVVVVGVQISHPDDGHVSVVWRYAEAGEIAFQSKPPGQRISAPGHDKSIQVIIPFYFRNTILPEFGKYNLEILKDGHAIHTDHFDVMKSSGH